MRLDREWAGEKEMLVAVKSVDIDAAAFQWVKT